MNKVDLVFSELIKKIHGKKTDGKYNIPKDYKANKKFPTIFLKDLIFLFYTKFGTTHNILRTQK